MQSVRRLGRDEKRLSKAFMKVLAVTMVALSITILGCSCPVSGFFQESISGFNVVLISWDGVQREHFYELLIRGALPEIAAISIEGGLVNVTITGHVADTKAGHAEMLTGYGPSITGVYSNRKFSSIPEGLTVLERVESIFGRDGVATIMVTGKTHNLGGEKGEPFHNVRTTIDVFDSNAANANVVGQKATAYLKQYASRRFSAFFHFSDPDSKGHKFGENSREYEQAIVTCDLWLGRIVQSLKKSQIYSSTIVLVTSDHGFDEAKTSHRDAPYVFAASNRHLTRNGNLGDIAPTALALMGEDPAQFTPPFYGAPLVPWRGATASELVKSIIVVLSDSFRSHACD